MDRSALTRMNGNGHSKAHNGKDAVHSVEVIDVSAPKEPQPVVSKEAKRVAVRPRDGYRGHVGAMVKMYQENAAELGTSVDGGAVLEKDAAHDGDVAREATAQAEYERASGVRFMDEIDVYAALREIYAKASSSPKLRNHPAVAAFRLLLKTGPRAKKNPAAK